MENLKIAIAKKARPLPDSEVELLGSTLPSTDHIRDGFKDLLKNFAAPAKNPVLHGKSAKWYSAVQDVLELTTVIAELIIQESVSVLISLESGWDITAVLTALSQILMDSTYRTFEGFRTLVEREFLSFGHRFTSNSIHPDSQFPNPIFILFLDCVRLISLFF